MRIALVVIWTGFLAYGVWRLCSRDKPKSTETKTAAAIPAGKCRSKNERVRGAHFIAAIPMPMNWRISPSDLRQEVPGGPSLDQFVARYVACPMATGDPVTSAEVQDSPDVSQVAGKVRHRLGLSAALTNVLNTGKHIDVFIEGSTVLRDVEVEAVTCDPRCAAIVQLLPSESALLSHIPESNLVLLHTHTANAGSSAQPAKK
jgi:hypothetical protein